jgi:hypothetical protein
VYSSTLSLTSALDGEFVSFISRPFYLRENDAIPTAQEAEWAPRPVWKGAGNIAPSGSRSPHLPIRRESLYRLRYRGPRFLILFRD